MNEKESDSDVKSETHFSSGSRRMFSWFRAAVLGGLAVSVVSVYWPTFDQPPKRDQLYYLLEMSRERDLGTILSKSISYNRTRTVQPGDTQLFRPGLFLLLGIQHYFFDYHFFWYRWVSVGIHFAVVLVLFTLLRRVCLNIDRSNPWIGEAVAAIGAGLFALNPAIAGVVSWEHIQGYMVFTGLVLLALVFAHRHESARARGNVFWGWFALLIAVFFHEAGVLFVPLFALFFALTETRDWRVKFAVVLLFGGIAVVYLGTSYWDYLQHSDRIVGEDFQRDLTSGSTVTGTLFNFLRLFSFTCTQPLVTPLMQFEHTKSIILVRDAFMAGEGEEGMRWNHLIPLLAIGVAVGLGLGVALVRDLRVRRFFSLLTASLLGAYVALYVVLRLNVRGGWYSQFLGINCQYVYFCFPVFVVLLFAAFSTLRSGLPKIRAWGLAVVLGVFVLVAGVQTYAVNMSSRELFRSDREKVLVPGSRALDALRRRGLSRFAFRFESISLLGEFSRFGAPLTTIYFGRHEVSRDPQAFILLPSGWFVLPHEEAWADLVETQSNLPFYRETISYDVITVRKGGAVSDFHASYAISECDQGWCGVLALYPAFPFHALQKLPFAVFGKSRAEVLELAAETSKMARDAASRGDLLISSAGTPFVHGPYRKWTIIQVFDRYYGVPPGRFTNDELHEMFTGGTLPVGSSVAELKGILDQKSLR